MLYFPAKDLPEYDGCREYPSKKDKLIFKVNDDNKLIELCGLSEKDHNISLLIIPKCITEIGDAAVFGYDRLKTVIMSDSVKIIHKNAFGFCHLLTDISFSNNLEIIGQKAFMGCTLLEEVVIPESVKLISTQAFYECDNLKKIYIKNRKCCIGYAAIPSCCEIIYL